MGLDYYLDNYDKRPYFVYSMLCQDGCGPLYVKFGITRRLHNRLCELRQGSPIPAKYFAYIEVKNRNIQRETEKALHKEFAGRRVRGEWFKFDSKSEADRRSYNDGCARAFAVCIRDGRYWDRVSVQALEKYAHERRAAFMKSKERRKIQARDKLLLEKKRAWRELDNYGK